MKKIIFSLAAASLMLLSSTAYAAVPQRLYVENKPIPLSVAPVVEQGQVLVPLRDAAEALGASLTWNQSTGTATLGKWAEKVSISIGKNTAAISNGYARSGNIRVSVPMQRVGDRVYVPLRFLSDLYGYKIALKDGSIYIGTPLSEDLAGPLYKGGLEEARKFVMNLAPQTVHFTNPPIENTHVREGDSTTYYFPQGEADRFFLLFDDTVSFYELKDGFYVITWQAHIPVGQEEAGQIFLANKFTNATGPKPKIDKGYYYYNFDDYLIYHFVRAGSIDRDGKVTQLGFKQVNAGKVAEMTGSLSLKLPDETRQESGGAN